MSTLTRLQKVGASGAIALVAATSLGFAPATAEDQAAADAAVSSVLNAGTDSSLAVAAAASVSPSVVTAVDFITNTDYRWDSQNNQVAFTLSGINQPSGANSMANGDVISVEAPAGVQFTFTGSIKVPDTNGVERFKVTRTTPTTAIVEATNVDAYNIGATVTLPTSYYQPTDTTAAGQTETREGYLLINGTRVNSGEDLTFTKPVAVISTNAFIDDSGQGYNANTGEYNAVGVGTFEPQPAAGTLIKTWNAPDGVRVNCDANFGFRTNNPSAGVTEWRWGANANPGVTFEVLSCTEEGYTVQLSGLAKGDQGYVFVPLIFDEIKEVYPDVSGTTTHTSGRVSTEGTAFRPNDYAAASEAQNAKIAVKTYVNDANPDAPTGLTADGQNSDANTADEAVQVLVGQDATYSVVVSNPGTVDWGTANILDPSGKVVDTVTVAPGQTVVWKTTAKVTTENVGKTYTASTLEGKVTAEDAAFIQGWVIPTAAVDVTTYINGEDANTPVTLAPGSYEVTGTIANPNSYALTSANTTVEWVAVVDGKEQAPVAVTLPADFNIPAGGEGAVPATAVELPKQGEVGGFYRVKVAQAYTLAEVLGGDGVANANAQDPAYATALTGAITTAPDETRVRVGEAFSIPLLDNDTTDPEGHPLDPATIKLSAADGWVENEDGSFTNAKWGITGSVVNGNFEGTAGNVEGTVIAPNYTVENTLGDVSELTGITIEVYDFHVGLESYVGEEQQDADTTDDSYKVTIAHDQQTVTLPVVLKYTNTGTEPITVTGFQQVNVSDGGDGFEITLDEPVTLAPGETFTDEGELEFPVGEHVVDFKVLTAEGVFATDPIVVVVDQEEAPAPVPTPELTPEATPETPVVEQEKPKTPTPVVPETGLEGKTVEAKTAAELGSADAAVVASEQAAPAGVSMAKVFAGALGALAALALAAWGFVTFRNRKAKDA